MEEIRWGARDLGLVDVRLGLEGSSNHWRGAHAEHAPPVGGHPRLQRGAAPAPTLEKIQRYLSGRPHEIVVVDDGSATTRRRGRRRPG
jgi:hypothetical protein